MAHPKASDWLKEDAIRNAGTKGFNALREIPKLLSKHYTWLNDFNFGFFSEEDVPSRVALNWTFLKSSHFDTEEFTKAIGLRHGLTTDANGRVRYNDNFIMIMPKEYRMAMIEERNRYSEEKYQADVSGQGYNLDNDVTSISEIEERQATIKSEPEPVKRPRGRPKKG